jgi:hypothetical protein
MDGVAGSAALDASVGDSALAWDRFAHWPRLRARLALLALLLVLIAAAWAPIDAGKSTVRTKTFTESVTGAKATLAERPRDEDLALYDRAIERIQRGENYYDFIVAEHRLAHYPVNPALAVRLPTLAYLDAWAGDVGQTAAAILLMIGVLFAWWRRLGEEPGGLSHRALTTALLFVGVSLGLNRYYFVLHELWAGMLLALSFGLHRPGHKWVASLLVAALAVAIREHALPFIALMAAMALWRRDWKEGAAWGALAVVFLTLLSVHLHLISAQRLPTDQLSPSWLALRGLSGWLSDIVLSSNIRFLPHWLAGPAVILMVVGWAGWRSPAGVFGTFLYLGYAAAFMIAGRPDNFYWGAVVAPAMFMGLAFAPTALRSLVQASFGAKASFAK